MKYYKQALVSGLVFLGVSANSLADSYTMYTTNNTQDIFTLKSGLKTIGTLDVNEDLKKFELDTGDTILFVSNAVPRLSVKYDQTNKRPNCFDLFQGYSCDFTKVPATTSYLLTIHK